MSIVVSDSTPLNYLIQIGEAGLLQKIYNKVYIPPEVLMELSHKSTTDSVKLWMDHKPEWLEIKSLNKAKLNLHLDSGEESAISLAIELQADAILLDDGKARNVAASYGLNVTGTLGVIIEAARRKLIRLEDTFDKLSKTNAYIHPDLFTLAKKLLEE